jgi:hypothetical protein
MQWEVYIVMDEQGEPVGNFMVSPADQYYQKTMAFEKRFIEDEGGSFSLFISFFAETMEEAIRIKDERLYGEQN